MTTAHATTIAVLGLGRMGTAMATRLAGHGWDVLGWNRSARPVEATGETAGAGAAEASTDTAGAGEAEANTDRAGAGAGAAEASTNRAGAAGARVSVVDDPGAAVAKADIVVLALFDGPACQQVLDRVDGALRADTIVVNTGTVAPAEASALARWLGPRYVHAPVLGSVPAVAAGTLQILVAADDAALDRVRPVLAALGTSHEAADAATAAALKLVANSSLAGAVLALRDCLQQADALGLPRDRALDVLALGHLSRLVTGKRGFLDGQQADEQAQFTVGALAKDMALLAAASHVPLRSARELADGPAVPEADIAAAATVPAVDPAVLAPLRDYIRGHATGDAAHFRAAFLPTAHVEGIRDGAFVSWPLEAYCRLFHGRPAADESTRSRRIDSVDVHGTVATATMTLRHGADTFTDVFLLVRVDDAWRIANKAYHRQGS